MNLRRKSKFVSEKGQALLLVLLAMSVVLTVALSIVSRSITDVSNSAREEDSTRAFSAAESGIERALISGSGTTGNFGESTFTSSVTAGTASNTFSHPVAIASGDTLNFWFVENDAAGNKTCAGGTCFTGNSLRVCWGNTGVPDIPAAVISIYYATTPLSAAATNVTTVAYDSQAATHGNNFALPDSGTCTIGTKTYPYQKNIDLTTLGIPTPFQAGTLLFARVKLLYNTTAQEVGISTNAPATFPAQGNILESTGSSNGANRKLQVNQLFGEVPPIFNNLIYSGVGVTK